jgi:hypothetical protein
MRRAATLPSPNGARNQCEKLIVLHLLIFTAVGGVVIWLWRTSKYLARLELKINTLWDFQLRRGAVEALEKGIATMNSPIP